MARTPKFIDLMESKTAKFDALVHIETLGRVRSDLGDLPRSPKETYRRPNLKEKETFRRPSRQEKVTLYD